jgi:hypothetical protein
MIAFAIARCVRLLGVIVFFTFLSQRLFSRSR